MKNIPESIYLQTGEVTDENDTDFNDLGGVTWCRDQFYKNDIKYSREIQKSEDKEYYVSAEDFDKYLTIAIIQGRKLTTIDLLKKTVYSMINKDRIKTKRPAIQPLKTKKTK